MDAITDDLKYYLVEKIAQLESDEKNREYIRNYLRANINNILRAIYCRDYVLYEHYGNFSILVHRELKQLGLLAR